MGCTNRCADEVTSREELLKSWRQQFRCLLQCSTVCRAKRATQSGQITAGIIRRASRIGEITNQRAEQSQHDDWSDSKMQLGKAAEVHCKRCLQSTTAGGNNKRAGYISWQNKSGAKHTGSGRQPKFRAEEAVANCPSIASKSTQCHRAEAKRTRKLMSWSKSWQTKLADERVQQKQQASSTYRSIRCRWQSNRQTICGGSCNSQNRTNKRQAGYGRTN